MGRRPHQGPEVARLRECRALRSAGRRRHARDVRAAPRRQAGDLCRPAEQPEDQPDRRGLEGRDQICRPRPRSALRGGSASCTTSSRAPTGSRREDEEQRREARRRSDAMTARCRPDDVEPGDERPSRQAGHGRPLHGRRAHQSLDHGDEPRAARPVRPGAVPPEPVLPDRPVRRRADGRARSIPGSAWCCSSASSGLFLRFWRANLWRREDGTWLRAAQRRARPATRRTCPSSASTMPARRWCSGRCRC